MKVGTDIDMDFDGMLYANQAAASEGTYLFESDFLSPPVGMAADLDLQASPVVPDLVNVRASDRSAGFCVPETDRRGWLPACRCMWRH